MKQFQRFGLDTANQCLLHNGAPVDLAPKPFAVLRYMVENPGRLITHDELLDALWPETFVQPQVLRTYMLELRKVLGDDAQNPRFIQTLPKRGYRFVAAVTEPAGAPGSPATNPSRDSEAHAKSGALEIVGRDAELESLQMMLRLATLGQRQMALVSGDPGIGKTALVDAFCQSDPSLAAKIARGQCVQGLGVSQEYYPVTEALSQLCAGPQGETAKRVIARLAPAWLGRGGSAESVAGGSAPAGSNERTLGDLFAALEEISVATTLILVFEDVHWADECTLNLISAMARRRAPARLLVLLTRCPHLGSVESALRGLAQDLLMRRMCAEVVLSPLKKMAVQQLCRRELKQQSLPAGLADFVHHRSEGNPLFVIAIVDHLMVEGILARKGFDGNTHWEQGQPYPESDAGVPEQLSRMIELVIERLGEDEQKLLEAASLMEIAFPAWAVAAALDKDPVEAEEACDALARRLHFVVRAGEDELPDGSSSAFYVFAHGLYRKVLYQRQTTARRARRHIRIAERLGELFFGREAAVARERAMHYQAAGDNDRATRVLEAAADLKAGVC